MIRDRIKDVWKAVEAMEEEAFDLPETVRKQSLLNISKYLKNDVRMVAWQHGMTVENLVQP